MQYKIGNFYAHTVFEFDGFAGSVDLVSVHQDFFGIPWDAFLAGEEPPAFWVDQLIGIYNSVTALGAGTYLSLTPFGGTRSSLAPKPKWIDDHPEIEEWHTECFDFSDSSAGESYSRAYFDYVDFMVELFQPEYLTTIIEMNIYQFTCEDEWPSAIQLQNALYDHIKARYPKLIAFPTFVLEQAWGQWDGCPPLNEACLAEKMAEYSKIKMDRFGVSDYPYHRSIDMPAVPDEYYTTVGELAPAGVVFGETGYANRALRAPLFPGGDCIDILQSDDNRQVGFMEQLFRLANEQKWDLVTWWSLKDFIPNEMYGICPCEFQNVWCAIYDAFEQQNLLIAWLGWGSMGIYDYDLQPKPAFTTWQTWFDRPLNLSIQP